MTRRGARAMRRLVMVGCVLLSSAAWAQQASSIAGVIKDTSGAVLPGVTVEAASPALIEKVRSAVSDSDGRYNIADLVPGSYVVTFSLPGFNTLKRDGIALTAGFTATVSVDLQVGALEETVTVTGAAPLVDTQNVRQQKVVSAELLSSLPTGSKAIQNLITLTPGMSGTADVGGSSGLYRSNGPRAATFHGKAGVKVLYDGMNILAAGGTGVSNGYLPNPAYVEEATVETGGISAESSGAGIVINQVPKSGGNTFSVGVSSLVTDNSLQSDNLTDDLRSRGLTLTNEVLRLYDGNVTVGGPIKQDRLWFFAASRMAGNKNTVAGVYFNKTPHSPLYTPDLDRPGYRQEWIRSVGSRFTWQASQKNKLSGIADYQRFFNRGRGEFADPVAATSAYNLSPQGLYQVTLNSLRTNKLLLQAGFSYTQNQWPYPSPGDGFMTVNPTDISILELSNSFRYNAKQFYTNRIDQFRMAERFSASYVTGSHAFKVGMQVEQGINNQDQVVHGDVNYSFLNGVPNQVTQWATPFSLKNRLKADLGLYAQDQWALKRVTLSYGLRFDYLNGYVPEQHIAAGQFVPARDFAKLTGLPRWSDLEPRAGLSFDVFGTGRTAVKLSMGRFVEQMGAGIANDNNPVVASVLSANRTWNDADGDYVPDCDLKNLASNGECGAISNNNFGKNNPLASRFDDAVLHGFGVRNYAWDLGAEVQHQLRPGLSVNGGYYRNWAANFRVTDNLSVGPGDFNPYCVTAPSDARLPGGGGYKVCGLYDLVPAKFGQVSNFVTSTSQFEAQTKGFGAAGGTINCGSVGSLSGVAGRGNGTTCGASDFFSFSLNTRLGKGVQLGGGVDTGRTVTDNCLVIDSPQQLLNCRVVSPFKAQTQVKAFATYPLPGAFAVSATYQNLSGAPYEANYVATNAQIAPSLGRNLAACRAGATCTATTVVPLIAPMTQFLDRRTQLDLRVTKVFNLGARTRLQGIVDIYNALNGSALVAANSTYGGSWLRPASDNAIGGVDPVLPGRLVQFGAQLTF